jgi:anti-sigma B factor antagonist
MNEPGRTSAVPEPSVPPEDQLRVTVKPYTTGVVVLHLAGDLDLYTSGVLRDQLTPELSNDRTGIVLDLTEVSFLGSAGLAELVSAQATATRNSVRLGLVASGRNVLRPLEVTGLRKTFQVFETLEAALREV